MNPQVVLRAPLTYIANYLQMTPEMFVRIHLCMKCNKHWDINTKRPVKVKLP